jgi:hypothetical protein
MLTVLKFIYVMSAQQDAQTKDSHRGSEDGSWMELAEDHFVVAMMNLRVLVG